MSFPVAQTHLESALAHVKSGNAAKAMHHIGHAMIQLKPMTAAVSGPAKIKAPPVPKAKPIAPPTASNVGAGLRGRLAGMNQAGNAGADENGGY